MKRERIEAPVFIVVSCLIALCSLLLYAYTDMSGSTYDEITAYKAENPHKHVAYRVRIQGARFPLTIDQSTETVVLTDPAQPDSLMEQADRLPPDLHIRLDFPPTAVQLAQLYDRFPAAAIEAADFLLGTAVCPTDCTELDLSALSYKELRALIPLLQNLPQLTAVELMDSRGESPLILAQLLRLQEACPALLFRWAFPLFGQTVSTDMTELYYTETEIGDEGLDMFRKIMPIMKNLTYLRLDTCGTTDEATAQLREELQSRCKVVWRVFFGQNNALTDTYKIWATWNLNTKEVAVLKYCNEVKYLDLGHNNFSNLDFMNYMPDLEMAIVALDHLRDISGIANCTKLEFLEIFSNESLTDEDLQHLSGLTNMKYLNISNLPKLRDLSFTDNMTQLRWLWCTMTFVRRAEINRVKELHPDCKVVYVYYEGNPTDYGWRYIPHTGDTVMSSVYQLVRARFGYDTWDFSRAPKGYLREEITFESLGLTPP